MAVKHRPAAPRPVDCVSRHPRAQSALIDGSLLISPRSLSSVRPMNWGKNRISCLGTALARLMSPPMIGRPSEEKFTTRRVNLPRRSKLPSTTNSGDRGGLGPRSQGKRVTTPRTARWVLTHGRHVCLLLGIRSRPWKCRRRGASRSLATAMIVMLLLPVIFILIFFIFVLLRLSPCALRL